MEARRELDRLERACREHGLPVTVQRRFIVESLCARGDHPAADQILEDVRKRLPTISRTTVYRALETLVRIGVVRAVCHPGSAARYEMETERHHHLVCLACGKIVDLRDPTLDKLRLTRGRSGFHISDYSIQFRGLCPDCNSGVSGRTPRASGSRKPPPYKQSTGAR